jgi:hypothetical protein
MGGHVGRMGDMINSYNIPTGKLGGKLPISFMKCILTTYHESSVFKEPFYFFKMHIYTHETRNSSVCITLG